MYLMLIPPDKVDQTRTFFRERGGVVLWRNQEIGVQRPEIMTPARNADGLLAVKPHWAYGNEMMLRPDQIGIRTEVKIGLPAEWFPVCPNCNGDGRDNLKRIAAVRGVDVVTLVTDNLRNKFMEDVQVTQTSSTCRCWRCQGTGHIERHISVAVRRQYWGGYKLTKTGEAKAEKTAKKLEKLHNLPKIHWDFEHQGYGIAHLVFYTEEIVPFILEDSHAETVSVCSE